MGEVKLRNSRWVALEASNVASRAQQYRYDDSLWDACIREAQMLVGERVTKEREKGMAIRPIDQIAEITVVLAKTAQALILAGEKVGRIFDIPVPHPCDPTMRPAGAQGHTQAPENAQDRPASHRT